MSPKNFNTEKDNDCKNSKTIIYEILKKIVN